MGSSSPSRYGEGLPALAMRARPSGWRRDGAAGGEAGDVAGEGAVEMGEEPRRAGGIAACAGRR